MQVSAVPLGQTMTQIHAESLVSGIEHRAMSGRVTLT